MRSMIVLILIQLLISKWSSAQCDKNVRWYSVKQEIVNLDDKVEEIKTDTLIITTTKTSITIAIHGKEEPFIANIKQTICEWKRMYISGKTSYKIEFTAPSGRSGEGTIIIEGKENKLFFFLELPRLRGKKMRIEINNYEENN